MPYGYQQYRLDNKISPNTVIHEVRMIRSMLAFINLKYGKDIVPHEIRPSDIHDYLDHERSKGLQDSTVNRKLIFIRQWFDYMWKINKIHIDFMTKLKYEKLELNTSKKIKVDYKRLLEIQAALLNSSLTLTAKLFFIFYMRGIRLRDIINIRLDDIKEDSNQMTICAKLHTGNTARMVFNQDAEIATLLNGIERSVFRSTPYLLSSKIKGEYVQYRLGSIKHNLQELSGFIGYPFRSEEIRFAYVHYLFTVENKGIEEIQEILGYSMITTATILKEALERIQVVDYNVVEEE